jgi:hypothetical protein
MDNPHLPVVPEAPENDQATTGSLAIKPDVVRVSRVSRQDI